MQIIDGKKIAADIREELKSRLVKLKSRKRQSAWISYNYCW